MGKLAILMATAFVDMIGAVMILPLLPFYAETMGASGFVIGVLISAFSIAQLLSAPLLSVPLWGKKLSDRHGRRPVLVLALAISAISYLVFAFAQSLWLLFVSRAVPGLGGGTVGVVQAYVADASEPEERAKGLGDGARVTRGVVARARVVYGRAADRRRRVARALSVVGRLGVRPPRGGGPVRRVGRPDAWLHRVDPGYQRSAGAWRGWRARRAGIPWGHGRRPSSGSAIRKGAGRARLTGGGRIRARFWSRA
jgi:hypothetical protein